MQETGTSQGQLFMDVAGFSVAARLMSTGISLHPRGDCFRMWAIQPEEMGVWES